MKKEDRENKRWLKSIDYRRYRFNPPDLIAIMPGLSAIFCIYGAIENYIEGRWLEVATLLACVSVSLVAVAVILKYTRRGS